MHGVYKILKSQDFYIIDSYMDIWENIYRETWAIFVIYHNYHGELTYFL